MAIFEEEPGDYGDGGLEAPPAPWEYEPELPPEIEQGEDRPVPEVSEYEEPPQPKIPPEDKYGPPPQIPSDEPGRPWPNGPAYPGERPYPEPPPPKRPVDPNDWTQSERALQEKWIPQINPGPLPPPYSTYYGPEGEQYGFFPQQPQVPESMFQRGKGWTPTPQFQETTTFTPDGYAETTTSPSNWMTQQVVGPKMPAKLLDEKFAQMGTPVYDPKSGRWIQPDPIVPDVRNPSRGPYANNNPVTLTDRAGRARREALLEGSDVRLSLPIVTRSRWGALPPNMISTREGAYDPVSNENGYALYSQLYPNRSLADILDTVVIHHEGNDQTYDPKAVQRKHMQQNGWADIGYHYIVGPDGTIYEGRDVGVRGSHAEGQNTGKIGILLLGDFQPGPHASLLGLNINMDFNGDNSPTPEQVRSTAALIVWLDSKYSINAVKAHRDLNPTECPGGNAMKFMPDFEKALRENKR